MKILIVDDLESRHEVIADWLSKVAKGTNPVIFSAYDIDDVKKIFREHKHFDYIFLDHDLGDTIFADSSDYHTGYTVAKIMIEQKITYDNLIVHSINIYGALNIQSLIHEVIIIPVFTLVRFNELPGKLLSLPRNTDWDEEDI